MCEACNKGGTVSHGAHVGVYEAIGLIQEAHLRMSPKCEERYRIRVSIAAESRSASQQRA